MRRLQRLCCAPCSQPAVAEVAVAAPGRHGSGYVAVFGMTAALLQKANHRVEEFPGILDVGQVHRGQGQGDCPSAVGICRVRWRNWLPLVVVIVPTARCRLGCGPTSRSRRHDFRKRLEVEGLLARGATDDARSTVLLTKPLPGVPEACGVDRRGLHAPCV